ncbi:amidohydrolase family protein [Rhodococcus sp. NPDC047139]|uniref:amidohydrolase family protein n=1 Tax=Rhodococcus sp. NPDC047139 TaxID=3155141 RepID=UPI0033F3208C
MFDAHLHIIDPRFPLVENDGYLPDPFTVDDYLARVRRLGVTGGAVVSGSFQAFDQTCLLDALDRLGSTFVGVAQLPVTATDDEIVRLDAAGVRAVRVNVRRGGSATLAELDRLARRVHDLVGWHAELYIDSRDLADVYTTIAALPAISVDHLGLSGEGLPSLLRLVENGIHVKATGFGRVDLPVADTLRTVADVNPGALVFGTDLPSTRAPRPFRDSDIALIEDALGGDLADAVLRRNASELYRIETETAPVSSTAR